MTRPAVSVVIPTLGRPALVVQGLRSVLAQSVRDLEAIVVLDGPDASTEAALAGVADERVRIEVLPARGGPGAARNAGVRAARAELVAFLDDDDEWLPGKLALQLEARATDGDPTTVVCGRVLARGGGADRVWPRRLPDADEPVSSYLLARRGLRWGETLVHTSTIVAARALLERVPFREDLERHEDLDWLLRAVAEAGARLLFAAPERPLAVWNVGGGRPRASRRSDPVGSLRWIRSVRPLVTRRAYAAFLLGWIPADARGRERARLLPGLVREAFRHGRPAPIDLVLAAAVTAVPARVRAGGSRASSRRRARAVTRRGRSGRLRRTRPRGARCAG